MSSTSDIFLMGQTQLNEIKNSYFLVLHCVSQRSMSSPKETVAINFHADDTLLTFFFLGCVAPFNRLLHGVYLKIVVPGVISYDNLWQKGLTFSTTFGQKTSDDCFPCLCVWTCQNSWHPKSTDLEQPSTSTVTITLPLPACRVEYSLSIFLWWSWHVTSSTFRHYCSARITILQPVMNFCSCHCSIFNTPAHCWTLLTFTVVPPLTLSRCS